MESALKQEGVSTLHQESDFNFEGLEAQNSGNITDGDSEGDTVDSDVEGAILAELYFRDVKLKNSGKKLSVAKQLRSSQVTLDQNGDGSLTSISFTMTTRRNDVKEKRPPATEGYSNLNDDGYHRELTQVIPTKTEEEEESYHFQQAGKKDGLIRTNTSTAKEDDGEIEVILLDEEGGREKQVTAGSRRQEGDKKTDNYVGLREIEEWGSDSGSSVDGEDTQHSSDMEMSDDQNPPTVGQLYLEVDEKDMWHIILKDIMGRDDYEREYGGRSLGKKNSKCFNCKQKGKHQANTCPHPIRHQVCFICAGYDHISSKCAHRFCTYCFQKQHRGRPCSAPWGRHTECQRCYCSGHNETMCHEGWRQYHNTPQLKSADSDGQLVCIKPDKQRQSNKVFCYNCARKGHFGHECSKGRPRGFPVPLTPHIAVYDKLDTFHNSRKRKTPNKPSTSKTTNRQDGQKNFNMRGRGDGLLGTPTHPPVRGHDNGHARRQHSDNYISSHEYPNTSYHHRNEFRNKNRHDTSPTQHNSSSSSTRSGHYHQPSLPHRLSSHNTTTREIHYSDNDCIITAIETPSLHPPLITMSDPQRRYSAPGRRFSHSEDDFPRTPLPDTIPRGLFPPPAKLMRRESEPYAHRHSLNNRLDEALQPPTMLHHQHRSAGGYERRGFRGSDRAVSFMENHRKDDFHHRNSHYSNW